MATLQELITRGRFIMSDAPSRLQVFEAVDGRRNVKDIATLTKRHVNNVRRDLVMLADAGLIQPKGEATQLPIYEKVPLARTIPTRYFEPVGKRPATARVERDGAAKPRRRSRGPNELSLPTEAEILEIAKNGEDQLHEFKAPGTEASKLTKEIAAMLNTLRGGIIFYGVEDDGTILGTDVSRQKLDQPLQNSVKGITPAASIRLSAVKVLGTEILVVITPPWNRRDVYQFQEKCYIRKGTNVFALKPEELKSLYAGQPVI
ncbi:MAG TPA: ATP-binding protein [Acidobacteriaceae bacterium]|nr:ATP-binding protein [Acidobacteriaceae bacterium]